jgi:hypothetical protein
VVTEPERIRPYFQPFRRNSWLLYAADFDPASSSLEFATYQFVHVERMGLLQEIVPTLLANLCYFLALSEEQLADFLGGCGRSTRPDASGFRALANAMPTVRQLHHDQLRPPQDELPEATLDPHTGLIVPASVQEAIAALQEAWYQSAVEVFEGHTAAHAAGAIDRGKRILDWLQSNLPPILVTGAEEELLWSPDDPDDGDALMERLEPVTESGAQSILEDLRVVAHHSRRFLAAMREPESMVDPAAYITESGLSFIHKEKKIIGYSIGPGENEARIWQQTPPFERFMLAARTVHEWGHMAAESDWILVPEELTETRETLCQELAALFDEIHKEGPEHIREMASEEVEALVEKSGSLGQGLLRGMLVRIEDFMANLLAQRFLHPDEMDTYVRNNVSCHVQEYDAGALYGQLARQVYEVQYLRLSRIPDPLDWFMKSTWFPQRFIQNGIITEAQFIRLVGLIGSICDCYRIDETKFDFGKLENGP